MIGYQNVLKIVDQEFSEVIQTINNYSLIMSAILKQHGGKFIVTKDNLEDASKSPYKDIRVEKDNEGGYTLIGVDNGKE